MQRERLPHCAGSSFPKENATKSSRTRSLSPRPQRGGWDANSTHLASHAWRRPVHPCSLSQGGRLYGKPKANKGELQPDVGRLSGSLSVPGVGSTCMPVLPARMDKPEQPFPLKRFSLQWKELLTFPEPSEQIRTSRKTSAIPDPSRLC